LFTPNGEYLFTGGGDNHIGVIT